MRKPVLILIAIAILIVPFTTNSTYILRLINFGLIYSLLSVSLNIVLGYAGQIALGHAAFFGIGAYTAALISATGSGLLFWPGFVAAGTVTGMSGLLIGIPTLRLKGHYLALATLGFGHLAVTRPRPRENGRVVCELALSLRAKYLAALQAD